MSDWRRAKGLKKAVNRCPSCMGLYPDDDYSFDDDSCLFCLFPESSGRRPVPMSHEYGVPKNVTVERERLDELDYLPEKQSFSAKESLKQYKNRKVYK